MNIVGTRRPYTIIPKSWWKGSYWILFNGEKVSGIDGYQGDPERLVGILNGAYTMGSSDQFVMDLCELPKQEEA